MRNLPQLPIQERDKADTYGPPSITRRQGMEGRVGGVAGGGRWVELGMGEEVGNEGGAEDEWKGER